MRGYGTEKRGIDLRILPAINDTTRHICLFELNFPAHL